MEEDDDEEKVQRLKEVLVVLMLIFAIEFVSFGILVSQTNTTNEAPAESIRTELTLHDS